MSHATPPLVRGGVPGQSASLLVGLFVCALGIVLVLLADVGLPPWDVLHQGLAERTPLTFGTANICVGLVAVALAWRLGIRPGVGTVANATLIGAFSDLLLETDAVPAPSGTGTSYGYLAAGILAFGLGSGLYLGAGWGAGPRDSLMLAITARTGARLSVSRATTELTALGLGLALSGPVGPGTAAFALLVGAAVELGLWAVAHSPIALPGASSARASRSLALARDASPP